MDTVTRRKWRNRTFIVGHHYWLTGWTSQQKVRIEIVGFPEEGIANVKLVADKRNRGIQPDAIDGEIMTTQLGLLLDEVRS